MPTHEGFGTGYTEREALDDWLASNQFEHYGLGRGHAAIDPAQPVISKRVLKPKIAKRAHIEHYKQIGSRKWRTRYRVEDLPTGNVLCYEDTQADAIGQAKIFSLRDKMTYSVICYKELEEGEQQVAVVTPGNSRPGSWFFSAEFKF